MPWVTSAYSRYYIRRPRKGGRRCFEYVGIGPKGERAAAEDAKKRAEQLALNLRRKDDEQAWQQATQPLDQLAAVACTLMRGALVAEGFHRHDRGEWRRKREEPQEPGPAGTG